MLQKMKSILIISILWLTVMVLGFSCYSLLRDGIVQYNHASLPEYDYESLQLQISIAPFDELKPPEYDAAALRAENPDFQGWLQIPDTVVSFPVVQGRDNAYYLKHSFSQRSSAYGCPFLEYTTTDLDRNLVVHGHNMGLNREEMFSSLVNYQDQRFAEEHATIFYSDPDKPGEERYTVFAVLNLSIHNEDGFEYRQQQFSDDAAFLAYVTYLRSHSIFQSDYIPTGELLILSTCNRAYGNDNRLLICAGKENSAP